MEHVPASQSEDDGQGYAEGVRFAVLTYVSIPLSRRLADVLPSFVPDVLRTVVQTTSSSTTRHCTP